MTRLQAVCSLITPSHVIADVGCDHGFVAEFCVKSGLCDKVIASDISASCLKKARDRLSRFDCVTFCECDGIGFKCDEAVIAGMGGHNIIGILNSAKELPKTLVLCPHRNTVEVRRAVNSLGYTIDEEILCKERGKLYFVFRATLSGEKQSLSELAYMFGLNFDKKCELLKEYLNLQYNTYMKAPNEYGDKLKLVSEAMRYQDCGEKN